jgi:hypothetical protein
MMRAGYEQKITGVAVLLANSTISPKDHAANWSFGQGRPPRFLPFFRESLP